MAKELPYFKFEPAEYLTKDISFCSLSAQGLFVNICCYYWQRGCKLTKDQLLRRLNNPEEFNELIDEGIIDIKNDKIIIKFLDNQLIQTTEFSKAQSEKGKKGGRPRKAEEKPEESRIKAEEKPEESHKIREDKIIENNIDVRKLKFADTLKPFLPKYGKELLNEFYAYWTEPNKSGTKFRAELEKTWSLERRLETWAKNDSRFGTKKTEPKKTLGL